MHHASSVPSCLASLSLLAALLSGCGSDAPDPRTETPADAAVPRPADGGVVTSPPEDSGVIELRPGRLTLHWDLTASAPQLPAEAACAARGAARVRLSVGLDAPAMVDCSAGSYTFPTLHAGMYSAWIELLDASGNPLDHRWQAVVVPSGGAAEARASF